MSRGFIPLSRAGLELNIFGRAGRAIKSGRPGSDGVLSRAGRGGFFFSRAGLQLPNLSRAGLFLSRGFRPGFRHLKLFNKFILLQCVTIYRRRKL